MLGRRQVETWRAYVYSLGGFGDACFLSIQGFFLNPFLLETVNMSAFYVAFLIFFSKAFDAINDPILGYLSDKTKSRFGRRKGWIYFCAIPLGIIYVLYWYIPPFGEDGTLVYYIIVHQIFSLFFSSVKINYDALVSEMTFDYHSRTLLVEKKMIFFVLMTAVSSLAVTFWLEAAGDDKYDEVYLLSAVAIAAMAVPLYLIAAYVSFEREEVTQEVRKPHAYKDDDLSSPLIISAQIDFAKKTDGDSPSINGHHTSDTSSGESVVIAAIAKDDGASSLSDLIDQYRIVFMNKPYMMLCLVNLMNWLVVNLLQATLFLFVKYVMFKGDGVFTMLMIIVQAAILIGIPFWSWVSFRVGEKKKIYNYGCMMWLLCGVALYFVDVENVAFVYPICFFFGIGVAMAFLIPNSMLPDVIDLDELQSGKRRDGAYYSFFVFFQKIGLAISLGAVNAGLGWVGYKAPEEDSQGEDVDQEQPEIVTTLLLLLFSLIPAFILALSFIPLHYYPIDYAFSVDTQNKLEQRRRENHLSRQ